MKKAGLFLIFGIIAIFLIAATAPPNLTPEETAKLDRGEIIVKFKEKPEGINLRLVEAMGIIDAPRERAWNVIGDYANYKEFMPQVQESEIRKKEGNTVWQYQKLSIPWPFPGNGTWYVIKLDHDPANFFVKWNMVEGNIKVNYGSWQLYPYGPGGKKTLAIYSLVVDTGFNVPAAAIEFANKQTVPMIIKAVRKRATDPRYN